MLWVYSHVWYLPSALTHSLRLGGKKSEFSSDQLWGLWLWLSFHVLKGMVVHHVVFVHSLFVSIPDNADDVLSV